MINGGRWKDAGKEKRALRVAFSFPVCPFEVPIMQGVSRNKNALPASGGAFLCHVVFVKVIWPQMESIAVIFSVRTI